MRVPSLSAGLVAVMLSACATEQGPADPLAGVYYPPPTVTTTYKATTKRAEDSSRERRINFTTFVVTTMEERPYPSPYIYAAGDQAEHLIVTSRAGSTFGTVYQARAELELMASIARSTPVFAILKNNAESYNFLDLANLLGFHSVTISNGRDFSYRVLITQ